MAEVGWSILRMAVAIYVGLCLWLIVAPQSGYVYYPGPLVGLTPEYFKIPFEDVRMLTEDGETVAGWFVPAEKSVSTGKTVLFSHGNAGNIGDRLDSLRTFHELGFDVLLYDYRGYGDSTGKPTEEGTYRDITACWDFLTKEKGVRPDDIVLFGRSLGGAVATWLAERVEPRALVIESTFASAADMAKKMFPLLPARLLCKFKYDTAGSIARISCPVIVAHSPQDTIVPPRHGRKLFEAAPDPKHFVEFPGGHNAGGLDSDKAYQRLFLQVVSGGAATRE